MTEIGLGIPIEESTVVKTDEDRRMWERMKKSMDTERQQGMVFSYGIGRDSDE